MVEKPKRKRSLLATLDTIERYHRQRMTIVTHLILSLIIQTAIWANWLSSYALSGRGFEGTFFTDRFTISLALLFILIGHTVVVRLAESKDRLIIEALRQHPDEVAAYDDDPLDKEPPTTDDILITDEIHEPIINQRKHS